MFLSAFHHVKICNNLPCQLRRQLKFLHRSVWQGLLGKYPVSGYVMEIPVYPLHRHSIVYCCLCRETIHSIFFPLLKQEQSWNFKLNFSKVKMCIFKFLRVEITNVLLTSIGHSTHFKIRFSNFLSINL